jgi:signal transduction histidine kinase/ActR/RegA family two-component response regulator/HAMP domain-containing protein
MRPALPSLLGNSSISRRIYVGFAFVLVLLTAEVGVALRGFARIRALRQEIAEAIDPPSIAANELERSVLYRAIAVRSYSSTRDPRFREDSARLFGRTQLLVERLRRIDLEPESRASVDSLVRAVQDNSARTDTFLDLLDRGATAAQLAHAEQRLGESGDAVLASIRALETIQDRLQYYARSRTAELQRDVERALVVAAFLVALALAATAVLTTRAVRRPALELVRAAGALERGDYAPALALAPPETQPSSELTQLGHAFGRMAEALRRREDRWAAEGRLGAALSTPLEPGSTAASALREVVAFTGANMGAVYFVEGRQLRRIAGHAVEGSPEVLPRAGLLDEALVACKPARLSPVPADLPFTLSVGFGEVRPRSILVVPLCSRGEEVGVLLLASVGDLCAEAASFAERSAGQLSIALQNALSHRRLAALARQLRESNDRLQAQNEALLAQGQAIREQSEELRTQAEEIRRRNRELSHAKEALASKAGALEEADRRKDELLATLGHELRNPLAAVGMAAQLLEREAPDERVASRTGVICRELRHLRRLVDDLLDLSRIGSGALELRLERFEVAATLERAVDEVRPGADAKSQRIAVRADPSAVVEADRSRIEQVLSNLLQNAIRHTASGGTISAVVTCEEGAAVIRVGAREMEISDELLQRIFEPFIQGTHSEGGEAAVGLGLALARRVVESHGGEVLARGSESGRGAELVARLPLAPGAAPVVSRARRGESGDMRLSVLVVEDHPDVAATMSDALEMLGYSVRLARDAEEGMRACLENPPDVALLDIGLPGRSGYDLAREIRSRLPHEHIGLVAVTGYGQDEDRRRAREAGIDRHLVKPVELDELKEVIELLAFQAPGDRIAPSERDEIDEPTGSAA